MGVFAGLAGLTQGVDYRGPLADRLYLPTAEPGGVITDAAREALRLGGHGRARSGAEPFVPKDGARFHFTFPGSVQGFGIRDGEGDGHVVQVPGRGWPGPVVHPHPPARYAGRLDADVHPTGSPGHAGLRLDGVADPLPGAARAGGGRGPAGKPPPVVARLLIMAADKGDRGDELQRLTGAGCACGAGLAGRADVDRTRPRWSTGDVRRGHGRAPRLRARCCWIGWAGRVNRRSP